MEVKQTCPLGSECEAARDGYIERCRWYKKVVGVDAQGVEHDEWDCAMAWLPILQLENANTNRGVSAAVESLRNTQAKGQAITLGALADMKRLNDAKDITN